MAEKKEQKQKQGRLRRLFRGRKDQDAHIEAGGLPVQDGGGFGNALNQILDDKELGGTGEYSKLARQFPVNRMEQYIELDKMASDPTIDSALKMHVAHALSAKTDTGEIIFIESATDEEDPIVEDLRSALKDIFNQNLTDWAYAAGKYGVSYVRPYGKPGLGVTHIRHDYYTHPTFVREYERAGLLCGFTSKHQQHAKKGMIRLMEPWKIVAFKIPQKSVSTAVEPVRVRCAEFDLDHDDYMSEEPVESQSYGVSLIRTAHEPWGDLQDAILALKMARQNAGKKDRFVMVNVGQQVAQKAA